MLISEDIVIHTNTADSGAHIREYLNSHANRWQRWPYEKVMVKVQVLGNNLKLAGEGWAVRGTSLLELSFSFFTMSLPPFVIQNAKKSGRAIAVKLRYHKFTVWQRHKANLGKSQLVMSQANLWQISACYVHERVLWVPDIYQSNQTQIKPITAELSLFIDKLKK